MFEKIPTRTLSHTVAQQLQKEIENGSFERGSKLPSEAMLARDFGVSRTVVREAISRLKNEGTVEARQGIGVFVTASKGIRSLRIDYLEALEPASVVQLLALRRAIEAEAASEAAIHRTNEQMTAIDAALVKIDTTDTQGKGGVPEDIEFHHAIAHASGNPYFLKTLIFLKQYLEAGMIVARKKHSVREEFSQQLHEEHAAIANAIRAGDPMAARAATQTHLHNTALRLSKTN
jgi:GntR family transcriptional repressor for pyruvate dehydrogenase complex